MTVHVGNVAEFNRQFFTPAFSQAHVASWMSESNHYACLAPLYSPSPLIVLLPVRIQRWWVERMRDQLRWPEVEVVDGLDDGDGVCRAVLARPALLERIAESGPLVPWGASPEYHELERAVAALRGEPEPSCVDLRVVRAFESKHGSYELFTALAGTTGVRVPRQVRLRSPAETAAALARRARRGWTSVVKSEFGVGGFGTSVVRPAEAGTVDAATTMLADLVNWDNIFLSGSLLIQDHVDRAPDDGDLTVDAVVGADGSVAVTGTGVMQVDGTHYTGVTTGPGIPAAHEESVVQAFTIQVGHVLSAAGYRGWFDVDFVMDVARVPHATEINLRRSGPAVAYSLMHRLDALNPARAHHVRVVDLIPLHSPLDDDRFRAHIDDVDGVCARYGLEAVVVIPSAIAREEHPFYGLALASSTGPAAFDAAEQEIRALARTSSSPLGASR